MVWLKTNKKSFYEILLRCCDSTFEILFSPANTSLYLHQYSELKTTLSRNLHIAGNLKIEEIGTILCKICEVLMVFALDISPLSPGTNSASAQVIRLLLWLTKYLISKPDHGYIK